MYPTWYITILRGRKHRDCRISHSEKWDRYYCVDHNKWLEKSACGGDDCRYCTEFPKKPLDKQGNPVE